MYKWIRNIGGVVAVSRIREPRKTRTMQVNLQWIERRDKNVKSEIKLDMLEV